MARHPYLALLRAAAKDQLPGDIDRSSPVSVTLIRELVDAGHLTAIDVSNLDGPAYTDCAIAVAGREYLVALEQCEKDASFWGKFLKHLPSALAWAFSIVSAVLGAFLVKKFIG